MLKSMAIWALVWTSGLAATVFALMVLAEGFDTAMAIFQEPIADQAAAYGVLVLIGFMASILFSPARERNG